jgi:hypothetical protein
MIFHGTTIEGIHTILEDQKIKAHKLLPYHQHAYASLSNQVDCSHEFGRILVVFQDSLKEQLIPVMEHDYQWAKENHEIMEYVIEMQQSEEDVYEEIMTSIFPKEHCWELVSIGGISFKSGDIEIWVCGSNPQQSTRVYQELQQKWGAIFNIQLRLDITEEIMNKENELFQESVNNTQSYLVLENKDEKIA